MISIIIPVKNEENNIGELLTELIAMRGPEREIIVVDGGSTDGTCKKVNQFKEVYWIEYGVGNRGEQLNAGIEKASGEWLWFVHGDSCFQKDSQALEEINQSKYPAGCLRLVFANEHGGFFRFLAWSSYLRGKYLHLIFGDQGLFVTAELMKELGGFPSIPLMEDWEFSRQLHKKTLCNYLNSKIYTSPRRYRKNGIWRTHFKMQWLKLAYVLGVKPEKLAKWYRKKEGK